MISKETIRFIHSLIHCNAKYDRLAEQYVLELDDLADFELEQFARLLMLDDPQKACEATGSDNPSFDKSMLPALTLFLQDSSSVENITNFVARWSCGVVEYFKREMKELLDNALTEYNWEHAA